MEFRNKYANDTDSFISESGSMFAPEYGLSTDKDGSIDLIQIGEKNIYDEIQSHADSVDINTILSRFENGDISVMSQRNGQYLDVSDMPNNFTELLQKIIIAERNFDELPAEIRSQYSSVEEYINDIGSEKWNNLFNPTEPVKDEPVKDEPVKEETINE